MKQQSQLLIKFFVLVFMFFLAGCASHYAGRSVSPTAENYLQMAANQEGALKQQYELLAADQLLQDNNLNDASQLINMVNQTPFDNSIKEQIIIVKAHLALKQNNPQKALHLLRQVHNLNALSFETQKAYFEIASLVYLRNNQAAYSAIAKMSLDHYLQDDATKNQNVRTIWQQLQTLPDNQINQMLTRTQAPILRGYFKLAQIARVYANQPYALSANIQNWQIDYPNHPANMLIPDHDTLTLASQTNTPHQIALLLPLTGPFGHMGQAVRDGVMTAFYKTHAQTNIRVYDTAKDSVTSLYAQAIAHGAEFVIGPMTKDNVYKLADAQTISVPTLALNYLPYDSNPPHNFFEFGVSPTQAASQTAYKMWLMGCNNLLIITPNNARGQAIQESFTNTWQNLGGKISASFSYGSYKELSQDLAQLLNISQSKDRIKALEQILNEPVKARTRRRKDVFGIFINATPSMGQRIVPLLHFYYAGAIPTFSTADLYRGYPNAIKDHDFNGIYFNDMAWVIGNNAQAIQVKNQIQKLWPRNFQANGRLYALGIDAFTLSQLLYRLVYLPNFPIFGMTGPLTITSNHKIYTQLPFAQFRNGQPIPV